jgi:hypothetical protein
VGLRNPPPFVDHVGDTLRIFILGRARRAIGDADFAVGVAQQRKWKLVLLGELRAVLDFIEAGAEDLDVLRLIVLVEVPEPGTLGRSTWGVCFRKKPQQNFLAAKVAELHLTSMVIGGLKLRRRIADF